MKGVLKMGNETSGSFNIDGGILQGDAGSPSTYCDFMELLLRFLEANEINYKFQLPKGKVISVDPQAWMDDIIIIVDPSLANKALWLVHNFFKEYNMKINWDKTKLLSINTDFTPEIFRILH